MIEERLTVGAFHEVMSCVASLLVNDPSMAA
jgi:hypothetical protein